MFTKWLLPERSWADEAVLELAVLQAMNIPSVSIVMSVFNGEPYLGETIESILNQTMRDYEFIIVDDGSTDHSWETLTSWAHKDARIVLIRNIPNAGVVRSLNNGLDRSRGSIIVRQDADDISHPERIEKQLAFLNTHPEYGLVACVPQLIGEDGAPLNLSGWKATENEEIQSQLLDHMCLCGPSIMIRRECLEAAGFHFSDGLNASEDYDLCLRLAEVTQLHSLAGHLYLYRQHPHSASRTQEQRQAFNKAVALERAIYRRSGPSPSMDRFAQVGRDFLNAAVIAVARKDLDCARQSLKRALKAHPPLLDKDQPLVDLVRAHTPVESIDAALDYTLCIFDDLLPRTWRLTRTKSRLLSYLHMSQVFSGARQGQYRQVRSHLWSGIRQNPTWLFNRGVIAIFVEGLLSSRVDKPSV